MKQIILGGIIAVLIVAFAYPAFAATYGKQFPRATLIGVVDTEIQTTLYKFTDGGNTCYIAQFGKSGVSMSCVR